MKKLLGILCIIAIFLNIYIAIYSEDFKEPFENKNGNNPDIISDIPSNFTVTMPEKNLGDIAQYDYSIFIEIYWENKNEGEWEKYTLNANGQLITKVLNTVIKKRDGFNMMHSTYSVREETAASFTILIEGSDAEPVTINGNLEVTLDEYIDINEKRVIQSITDGQVEVDKIRQLPIPLSFDGTKRFYPDINVPKKETLDEKIFLGNQKLKLGDSGNITEIPDVDDWLKEYLSQTYHWKVEGAEKMVGYKSLILNISTNYFEEWLPMPFTKKVSITNEVPFPIKVFIRTNTSAEDENGSFYTIIEHKRSLVENGFTSGSENIPWDSCQAGAHFLTRHPQGEFTVSNYMPKSGSNYDDSSFNYNPEDAVEFALKNSDGLNNFLNRYNDVIIAQAVYKVEKDTKDELDPAAMAGSHNWNLSFRYSPTRDEEIDAWQNDENPNWCYYVNLTRNLTKETGIDKYSEEIKIINEYPRYWQAPFGRSELEDETLTLASSEKILKLDEQIENEAFNNKGEIDFRDTIYKIETQDMSASSRPGLDIIETITGITLPRVKYSWKLEKGDFIAGDVFTATIDIETGQLRDVIDLEGTALFGLFD